MTEQATPPPPSAPQPGYPAPAGDGTAPGGDPAPSAVAPAKSSVAGGIVKRIIGAVVVFAVISIGGLIYKNVTGAPETAKVGDCLSGQAADEIKTIDCTDAAAAHKIVGKVEDKTEAEFKSDEQICSAYPTTENAYWEGTKGGKGYVLCLEPVG